MRPCTHVRSLSHPKSRATTSPMIQTMATQDDLSHAVYSASTALREHSTCSPPRQMSNLHSAQPAQSISGRPYGVPWIHLHLQSRPGPDVDQRPVLTVDGIVVRNGHPLCLLGLERRFVLVRFAPVVVPFGRSLQSQMTHVSSHGRQGVLTRG